MISAASNELRLPAMAFKITSCTFIIRSISADETLCSASAFRVVDCQASPDRQTCAAALSRSSSTPVPTCAVYSVRYSPRAAQRDS
jgi:hypothetical protein